MSKVILIDEDDNSRRMVEIIEYDETTNASQNRQTNDTISNLDWTQYPGLNFEEFDEVMGAMAFMDSYLSLNPSPQNCTDPQNFVSEKKRKELWKMYNELHTEEEKTKFAESVLNGIINGVMEKPSFRRQFFTPYTRYYPENYDRQNRPRAQPRYAEAYGSSTILLLNDNERTFNRIRPIHHTRSNYPPFRMNGEHSRFSRARRTRMSPQQRDIYNKQLSDILTKLEKEFDDRYIRSHQNSEDASLAEDSNEQNNPKDSEN